MNTLLIGPRGCGKTTVGQDLARELNVAFVDLDQRTLARFGKNSIRDVWREHGESAWRDAETAELANVLQTDHQVIALGGGTPMIAKAREVIDRGRKSGLLKSIYLKCPVATLVQRLRTNPGDRPSLTGADIADEMAQVLSEREPAYQAVSDIQIDASAATASELAHRLATQLK